MKTTDKERQRTVARQIKTCRGLVNEFGRCSTEVKGYFPHLPKLVEQFPLDVCLAYMFARMEQGQNLALYCGIVKVHKADATLAWQGIQSHHITRDEFRKKFRVVFSADPAKAAQKDLAVAEKVRDAVMHGKSVNDAQKRDAVAAVFWYAEEINKQLDSVAGFKPFRPSLKGFKGRARSLDKNTTRWILKGMGFDLS